MDGNEAGSRDCLAQSKNVDKKTRTKKTNLENKFVSRTPLSSIMQMQKIVCNRKAEYKTQYLKWFVVGSYGWGKL